ncbi:dihydroorotase [Natrialbaceae archaeon A-arb3/5]
MVVDLRIDGGTIVTESSTLDASVAIEDGEIDSIGSPDSLPDADEHVDASGLLVMPGVVDPHTHIADPFSIDTYEAASHAAALGGVTTCIDFAWQAWTGELSPFEEESTLLEGLERKREKAADSIVDYSYHAAIAREDPDVLEEIPDVIDSGLSSFKMFTAYEMGLSNGFMDSVFEELADHGAVAVLHTEDGSVCDQRTERLKAEGRGDAPSYPDSRPDYAEAMAADDAARMAVEAGCKYFGIHTSCRKAADVLESYRTDHPELIRAETCTHYTTLDDSVYEELGNLPMIAPPIRSDDDVEAMFEYMDRGTLDLVSTDHCAYTRESKQVENWWDSSFGANGLQVSLPVFFDEAVNNRDRSYSDVVRKMCANPARIYGMPQKGTLEPGTDADIVLFNPTQTETITAENNASKADFSIYEGREVTGSVVQTFVRGQSVVEDGEVVADAGHGEFVEREIPDWEPQ